MPALKKPPLSEAAQKEHRRAYSRKWLADNRVHMQDYRVRERPRRAEIEWCRLLRGYGISVLQYQAMFKGQSGLCAICLKPEKNRRLAVDHDHVTGRVRGLLCWWCNNKLLASRNKAEMLRRAADYLDSDFDGRKLEVVIPEAQEMEVTVVEADGVDRAVAGLIRRVATDGVVLQEGLLVMSCDEWRKTYAPQVQQAPQTTT